MTEPVKLAVPNKGRLKQPSIDLLNGAGLAFEVTERALAVPVANADVELLFVRTEDIPELVSDGVAELGITGVDLLTEFDGDLSVLADLEYGRCRLAAAVPNSSRPVKLEDLSGCRVATSHPNATAGFFGELGIGVTVVPLRGSVELATKLGVADAIVDLVSTGSTLRINGLREIGTLLESVAVLVSAGSVVGTAERIATAIRAVVAARRKRYLLLNAPAESVDAIADIIPGLEAPTIMPLAEEDMYAIHSVVAANDVWHLLPRLEEAGGRGILVLPIEQLIP